MQLMSGRNLWEVSTFSSRTLTAKLVCGKSGSSPGWSGGNYRLSQDTGELVKINRSPECGDQVITINQLDPGADYLLLKVLWMRKVEDVNLFRKRFQLSHFGLSVTDLPQILDVLDEATRRNREGIKVTQRVAAMAAA